MLGMSIDNFQTDIVIDEGANTISGTIKYIKGYEFFNDDPNLQDGNFLVLHINAIVPGEDVEILIAPSIELLNGDPVAEFNSYPWESGLICIFRITDPETQFISITAKEGSQETNIIYILANLIIENEPEASG